jgi:hypothetical protein
MIDLRALGERLVPGVGDVRLRRGVEYSRQPSAATPKRVNWRTLRRRDRANLSVTQTVKFTLVIISSAHREARQLGIIRSPRASAARLGWSKPEQFAASDGAINRFENQRAGDGGSAGSRGMVLPFA